MADKIPPALSKENLDEMMKKLSSADRQKVEKVLADPALTKKILATPEAQALLKKLSILTL